jgi:RsiW-degrading membrane proteinase PrsW (M82 family)
MRVAMFKEADDSRLLMGSPLRRRGVCILVSAALLIVLAFAAFIHLSTLASMRMDVALVYGRALAYSSALALIPLTLLWFLDRRERESPWLVAAVFLWGGCVATAIAAPFNSVFFASVKHWVAQNPAVTETLGPNAAMLLAAPISAPIVEEIAKALAVSMLFWLLRAEFDGIRDGIVYGALVGVGFNWSEVALYVARGYAEDGVAPYGLQLGGRYALVGLGGHAMFSAIFGASLGLAQQTRRKWLRIVAPLGGLGLAIAAHMINNALPLLEALASAAAGEPPSQWEAPPDIGFGEAFVTSSLVQLINFVPFVMLIALAVWRSGLWERRVIREELAGEVGGAVTPDEYRDIVADGILRTRRIDGMRPRQSAALVNAQHELAFRKHRVKDEGGDPESDPLVTGWRRDIHHLRTAI